MIATTSQYQATARFHDRIAAAFAAVGRVEDSNAAKEAAERCKKTAERANLADK